MGRDGRPRGQRVLRPVAAVVVPASFLPAGKLPPDLLASVLAAGAPMPPEVEALARKYLRKPVVVQVGRRSEAASTVTHAVYPVPRERKNTLLVELLKKAEMDSVLVFTRTKHGANRVVDKLRRARIGAEVIHGNKSQNARQRALASFKNGQTRVLVATDVASRGIHVEEIVHVINYDLPQNAESFIHRVSVKRSSSDLPSCADKSYECCSPLVLNAWSHIFRLMLCRSLSLVKIEDILG